MTQPNKETCETPRKDIERAAWAICALPSNYVRLKSLTPKPFKPAKHPCKKLCAACLEFAKAALSTTPQDRQG